uniref:Uncharacterized protein n=1 Tax=Globisporangium ultimum (strain ATCC 200006 / CBS 805.95 / DAOM BR144) TaxID=431595 RepID=K3WCY0_GLOUD
TLFGGEDGDASWGPVTLCGQIEHVHFERWLELHEGVLWCWQYEPTSPTFGQVVLYSQRTRDHHAVAQIENQIRYQIVEAGRYPHAVRSSDTPGYVPWNVGDRCQALIGWIACKNHRNGSVLTLFIETASKNESLKHLRETLQCWTSLRTTQIAIGVKTFASSTCRVEIIHVRDMENADVIHSHEVEFGKDALSQSSSLLPKQLSFSLKLLYVGGFFPASLEGHEVDGIVIDSMELCNRYFSG